MNKFIGGFFMKSEEIIAALAVKYGGDWEDIMCALTNRSTLKKEVEEQGNCYYGDVELEPYLDIINRSNYKYITILSDDYPQALKQQYMPPFVLFYYGDISLLSEINHNVAVVGSRECTDYGARMTREVVSEVAKEYTIVSGMARGIDAIAHQTAIDVGGKTIAVLGSGIDYCYPYSNRKLYAEIKKNHLVVSEYPGTIIPEPTSFPRRNRIIAMISKGLIVTEAYAKSGTLTTVMFALQCSRPILCVPHEAGKGSECNRLISDGAYPIEDGKMALDILDSERHIF